MSVVRQRGFSACRVGRSHLPHVRHLVLMAVGNNSIGFIAMMARLGWTNHDIRVMYDHAVECDFLKSPKEDHWKKVALWYRKEKYGAN